MWSKLDDALIDHRKVFHAGDLIGRNGPAIALGVFALGLMWTNKHLTDGHLPSTVVKSWRHVAQPIQIAEALVASGLWEKSNGGYVVHDFHDHNFNATAVQEHRDQQHEARSRAGRLGGLKSAETRRRLAKQEAKQHG